MSILDDLHFPTEISDEEARLLEHLSKCSLPPTGMKNPILVQIEPNVWMWVESETKGEL